MDTCVSLLLRGLFDPLIKCYFCLQIMLKPTQFAFKLTFLLLSFFGLLSVFSGLKEIFPLGILLIWNMFFKKLP